MADPKGFLKFSRKDSGYRPVAERVHDFHHVEKVLPNAERIEQAARCMDCGVPFCNWGCTLESKIPEWQDAIHRGDWKDASDMLHSTNIFPEFTGAICPALCEASCVLALNDAAVTIRENEWSVADRAFREGYVTPIVPLHRSGKKVAVIGSGPCGLVLGALLNREGHSVVIFEQDDRPGGLLRYGIPDFKLEKWVVDRRVELLKQEGVEFRLNCKVGRDVSGQELRKSFDAVCLAIGAMQPRDLTVPGRDLKGVYFAMDYLTRQNKIIAGDSVALRDAQDDMTATGKDVIVIGGGDTGSDCVGTAHRQGARRVVQLELLPKPPERKGPANPNWPNWPMTLRSSSSHLEGCDRDWAVATKRVNGDAAGRVKSLSIVRLDWSGKDSAGRSVMNEIPGSEFEIPAQLVLLAMGFVHSVHRGLVEELGLTRDARGNIQVTNGATSVPGVFAAGDAVRGASLVVHAMASGKKVAQAIHLYLTEKQASRDSISRTAQVL